MKDLERRYIVTLRYAMSANTEAQARRNAEKDSYDICVCDGERAEVESVELATDQRPGGQLR